MARWVGTDLVVALEVILRILVGFFPVDFLAEFFFASDLFVVGFVVLIGEVDLAAETLLMA